MPNPAAIGEGEAPPPCVQLPRRLPSRLLVLHRATIVRATVTLLAAVCEVALDPGAGGGGLVGMRVDPSGEGVFMCEAGTEGLQVMGSYTPPSHPQPHALVAHVLGGAIGFVNRHGLGAGEAQLILVDEHPAPPLRHNGGAQRRCTTAVHNGSGADVPTEYGRKIRWWSSARAIHPLHSKQGMNGPLFYSISTLRRAGG